MPSREKASDNEKIPRETILLDYDFFSGRSCRNEKKGERYQRGFWGGVASNPSGRLWLSVMRRARTDKRGKSLLT